MEINTENSLKNNLIALIGRAGFIMGKGPGARPNLAAFVETTGARRFPLYQVCRNQATMISTRTLDNFSRALGVLPGQILGDQPIGPRPGCEHRDGIPRVPVAVTTSTRALDKGSRTLMMTRGCPYCGLNHVFPGGHVREGDVVDHLGHRESQCAIHHVDPGGYYLYLSDDAA